MTNIIDTRLAVEVMGWEKSMDGPGNDYWEEGNNHSRFFLREWHPSRCLNQMALLEARIKEKGLGMEYVLCLQREYPVHDDVNWAFNLITATAEQRANAVIKMLEEI